MQATRIDHVNFTVRDFEASADWYRRLFGFEVVEKAEQDGQPWGVLRSEGGRGEAMLCIYQAPDRAFVDRFGLRDRKIHGFGHFSLRIHDEAVWLEAVQREKLTILYGGVIEWPHSKSWYITDPTGYEIEVVLWNDEQVAFETRPDGQPAKSVYGS